MRRIRTRVLAIVAVASLLSSPAATSLLAHGSGKGRGPDRGRPVEAKPIPPQSTYRGLTYGDWVARWWQDSFATLEAQDDPFAITLGSYGGGNDIVFLAGAVQPAGTPTVRIPVTIPADSYVFVPIITVECSVAEPAPFHGENEEELRACANGLIDLVSDQYAAIDGKPVSNPLAYRTESPLFRYGPLAETNVLHLPAGTQSDAVGAGYFLLLPPFSPGIHRIVVRANVHEAGIGVDAEFIVKVDPSHRKK